MALSIVTLLGQYRLHLADVREGKLLAGALLYQLLSTHLQVLPALHRHQICLCLI